MTTPEALITLSHALLSMTNPFLVRQSSSRQPHRQPSRSNPTTELSRYHDRQQEQLSTDGLWPSGHDCLLGLKEPGKARWRTRRGCAPSWAAPPVVDISTVSGKAPEQRQRCLTRSLGSIAWAPRSSERSASHGYEPSSRTYRSS